MADLIDRADVIALIKNKQKKLCPVGMFGRHYVYGTDRCRFDAWDEIADEIEYMTTIDPESLRPVGHWECKAEPFYICSNCKQEVEMFACDDMMDYCPHCGARMEVQDDE